MKNDKLIPGMILVMIGAIFLLNNFGYIHFHWRNLIFMWPVFLVIGGVNLVLSHNRTPWASVLKIAVVVGGFALILFGNFNNNRWWSHATWHYSSDSDDNDGDDNDSDNGKLIKGSGKGDFSQPYDASIKAARLNISGGANTFRLNDSTNELFKADTKQFHGRYELLGHKEDSIYVLDFSMKNNKGWNWGNGSENNIADISLNTNPEWEVNVEAGATDLNFDLSKYKLRELKLSGGAGQFVVKVGQPLAMTNINVSTGASDVTIEVPENAACQIQSDTGLSDHDFDSSFVKNGDGDYETANFGAAKNKIYIHISGGISDFKVHKY